MVKKHLKGRAFVGVWGNKIHPDVTGCHNFDLLGEALLQIGKAFLCSVESADGDFQEWLWNFRNMADGLHIISDYVDHVIYKGAVYGVCVTDSFTGDNAVASWYAVYDVHDAAAKFFRNPSPG